ncbi:protein PIN-LIKES 2-like [Olea europaea var. sylvestris]|uniref:protein PIN-LIKES 2-like n=1 Tax=Olea europaea var. sylvestris TaxID=158386 RepID=UPI000C1D8615|nr:protein PIN-LIKES 2-like [Olea europaea var. sylvestris]
MTSGGEDILSAIVPLLKLLSLTLIGLVLAHRRTQITPKDTFKLLSKLVFALFLPCLIFTHLGKSITLKNIAEWWFIPINVLVSTAFGCILGILVVIICRPPPQFTRFTIIMTAFGNTGNLPIAIIGSVCHGEENLFGPDCKQNGVAYWVSVILVYTLVYHMMEPPLEYYEIVGEEGEKHEQQQSDEASKPLLVEAEWPGIEDEEIENSKTPLIARIFKASFIVSQTALPDIQQEVEDSGNSPVPIRCLATPRVVRKMRIVAEQTPIWNILQPPTIASLLADILEVSFRTTI